MRHLRLAATFVAAVLVVLSVSLTTPASAAAPQATAAVVNGKIANAGSWKFAVALLSEGEFFCGGSLIAPNVVLTAAHCVADEDVADLTVIAGHATLTGAPQIPVVGYAQHPHYDSENVINDFAVVTLAQPVTTIKPVRLARPSDSKLVAPGQLLAVAGWGLWDRLQAHVSDRLRTAGIRVLRPGLCEMGPKARKLTVCAGDAKGHRDSCNGDSGGPLINRRSGTPILVGLVSYGPDPCGSKTEGGVYARVAARYRWIRKMIASPPQAGPAPQPLPGQDPESDQTGPTPDEVEEFFEMLASHGA